MCKILCGLVAAYVDDFIITGVECVEFTNLKKVLRVRFRWGTWKKDSFQLCGVNVSREVTGKIELDQKNYTRQSIDPVDIPTHRDLETPLTPHQITMIRACWGALQWKVTQTPPQHALAQLSSRLPRQCDVAINSSMPGRSAGDSAVGDDNNNS